MEKDADRAERLSGPAGAALYGATVEYGLHCLVWLVRSDHGAVSSRDLAELQGVPPTLLAKIMMRLQKAEIVVSSGGFDGGYRLRRLPQDISVLEVVDAIEDGRRLFECREVRRRCAVFGGSAPEWAVRGTCGIHGVMLRAERAMRLELARTSLLDIANGVRAPAAFEQQVAGWIGGRSASRAARRREAVAASNRRRANSRSSPS